MKSILKREALLLLLSVFLSVQRGEARSYFLLEDKLMQNIGEMPEIKITAPRYNGEEADTIGIMPGVTVFAERYKPKTENKLFMTYKQYRDDYKFLFSGLIKYALIVLGLVFMLVWSIIIFVKIFQLPHAPVIRHQKKKNTLHQYYLWRKRKIEDSMIKKQ